MPQISYHFLPLFITFSCVDLISILLVAIVVNEEFTIIGANKFEILLFNFPRNFFNSVFCELMMFFIL